MLMPSSVPEYKVETLRPGAGTWKKCVFTLVPIKNRSRAPYSGTKCERSLKWTHLFFQVPTPKFPVLEYKVSTLYSGTELGINISGTQCLNTALRPCYTRQFFLQLATQQWRIKNLSSCRGGVTLWQLVSQLATRTITNKMAEISRERMRSSDWPIVTKLRCKLQRECYTLATCLATLWKVEGRSTGRSTFLATRNATIAVAK